MPLASDAFNATFGLLVVFGGIGLLAGGLVIYCLAQVLAERAENQRLRQERDVLKKAAAVFAREAR